MTTFLGLASLIFLLSCAHLSPSDRTPAQVAAETAPVKALPLPQEDITVWNLKTLAQKGRIDILEDLFNNHGLPLEKLPEGYAAGAGARVLDLKAPLFSKVVDELTGFNWRGKIFFPSENPRKSMGLNRIKQSFRLRTYVKPMASFVTELVPRHPLTPEAKSPLVTLNYAKPVSANTWQEHALTQIEVYDLMVAVPGKYGPVFIGKTWLGAYAKDRSFKPNDGNRLIAWFFLDFNADALAVQQKEHWDGAIEKPLQPMPMMTEKTLPPMPELN